MSPKPKLPATPPPTNEALLLEGMSFLDAALTHFMRVDEADPRGKALSHLTHGLVSLGAMTLMDLLRNKDKDTK